MIFPLRFPNALCFCRYHAVSLNILADWFNTGAATPGGRVTVYLEDNMQAHTTQRE